MSVVTLPVGQFALTGPQRASGGEEGHLQKKLVFGIPSFLCTRSLQISPSQQRLIPPVLRQYYASNVPLFYNKPLPRSSHQTSGAITPENTQFEQGAVAHTVPTHSYTLIRFQFSKKTEIKTLSFTHAHTQTPREHLLFCSSPRWLTGLFVSAQRISGPLGILPYSSGTNSDRDAV